MTEQDYCDWCKLPAEYNGASVAPMLLFYTSAHGMYKDDWDQVRMVSITVTMYVILPERFRGYESRGGARNSGGDSCIRLFPRSCDSTVFLFVILCATERARLPCVDFFVWPTLLPIRWTCCTRPKRRLIWELCRRHYPEDNILHCYWREKLSSNKIMVKNILIFAFSQYIT